MKLKRDMKTEIFMNNIEDVLKELEYARTHFAAFNSAHEGYAVLLEEVDELWDEIKKKEPCPIKVRAETIQVAAMALRFLEDICHE
jgi:hypothetical protein